MVQRKGPDIACQKTEPKKGGLKQEKHHPLQDQDMRRKLRKARSIKRISELEDLEVHLGHQHLQPSSKAKQQLPPRVAPPNSTKKQLPPISRPAEAVVVSPNYMKPTTSSDARSERSQVVTAHESSANDKKRNPVLGKKSAKFLARKSSLKPVRTVTKKCPAMPLFPEVSTSKATCSSILKDSRFPKELELAPGSTEAEGTSTMKVCPFTYCSLNGHWHQPLPPLRSFISARRRLLKTQKSIKLKRLTSSRRRCSKKIEKSPPEEDLGHDFFVEIYANSYEESAESAVLDLSNYGDDEEDCDDDMDSETFSELLEVTAKEAFASSLDGCYSEISYDDGLDKGEFSASEKEVLAGFLEFIENQEDEAETPDGENCKWEDGGYLSMDSSDIGEQLSDTEAYEALLEAIDVNQGDDDDARSVEGGLEACSSEHDQRNKYADQALEFLQSVCGDEFSDLNSEESVGESPYGDDNQVENDGSQSMDEVFFNLVLMGLEEDSIEEVADDREFQPQKDHDENVSLEEMEFLGQLFSGSARESEEEGVGEVLEIKSMVAYEVAKEPYLLEDAFSSTEAEAGYEVITREQHKDHIICCNENASSEEIDFLEHLISESTQEFEEECAAEIVTDNVLENPHPPEDAFSSTEAGFGVRVHEQHEDHIGGCDKGARSEEIEFLEHLFSESSQELEDECAAEVTETKAMVEDVVPEDPYLQEDAFSSTEAEEEFGVRACQQHKDHVVSTSEGVETEAAAHEELEKDPNLSDNAYDHQMESEKTGENAEEVDSCVNNGTRTGECIETVDGQTNCPHRNRYTRNSKHSPSEREDELRLKLNIVRRNIDEDSEDELKAFNPRAPNFLEVEPDPEAEKVDLRHQTVDERKNAEEWMIDHALQEVVNKLAPARKKKVALIVEAIETVAPMHTYQPPLKHGDVDFSQARSMQACS